MGYLTRQSRGKQPSLFPETPETHRITRIIRNLQAITGRKVEITLTDNRVSMISFRREKGKVRLRLQRIFLDAPSDVIREIGRLITARGRITTPEINEFIRKNRSKIKQKPPRSPKINPRGRHFNLQEIFDRLNRVYFGGRIQARITWGRRSPGRSVRKRTLGSYSQESRIIRINPILDRPGIPRFFIEYVIYHEMLHARFGIKVKGGRQVIHPPEFRTEEKKFRQYQRAIEWEKRIR